jgi:hypothetical protein
LRAFSSFIAMMDTSGVASNAARTAPTDRESTVPDSATDVQVTFGDSTAQEHSVLAQQASTRVGAGGEIFKFASVMDRVYTLGTVNWTTAAATNTVLWSENFPTALLAQANIARLIDGYRLMRSGFRIAVRSNTQRMMYGTLMLVAAPYCAGSANVWNGTMDVRRLSGFPHKLISCVESEVVSIDLPFIFDEPWYDLQEDIDVLWTVALVVVNPLSVCTSEPGTTATVTITGSLIDVELSGLSGVNALTANQRVRGHAQSSHSSHKFQDLTSVQNAEAAAKAKAGNVAHAVSKAVVAPASGGIMSIPILGSIIRGVENFGSAVGSMITGNVAATAAGATVAAVGLAKPRDLAVTAPMRLKYAADLTHGDDVDTSVAISYKAANKINVAAPVAGVTGDEMDLGDIARRPMLTHMYLMRATTTAVKIPVHPLTNNVWSPDAPNTDALAKFYSFTAFVASLFAYWRGSMKFLVHISSCPFMSGRLRFRFFPGMAYNDAVPADYPQDVWTQVVDIQSDTSKAFVVPFVNHRLWEQVCNDGGVDEFSTPWTAYGGVQSGVLVMDWLNPLVCPDPTVDPGVYVNIYTAAGDDMQFGLPCRYLGVQPVHGGAAKTKGRAQYDPLTEFSRMQPFHPSADGSLVMGFNFGEEVTAVTDFIHKYTPVATTKMSTNATLGVDNVVVSPHFDTTAAVTTGAAQNTTDTIKFAHAGGTDAVLFDVVQYFGLIYRYWAGSLNYKFETSGVSGKAAVTMSPSFSPSGSLQSWVGSYYPLDVTDVSYQPMLSAALPFNRREFFDFTQKGRTSQFLMNAVICQQTDVGGINLGPKVRVYKAAGDDFRFYYVQPPPFLYPGFVGIQYAAGQGVDVAHADLTAFFDDQLVLPVVDDSN